VRYWPSIVIAGLAIALAGLALSQAKIEPRARPNSKQRAATEDPAIPSANLRVDTNLVLVPVTVNDELNHPVVGLEKDDFRIFDDAQERPIVSFSSEDEPIALGFIFDTSGSMKATIPEGRRAAAEFLKFSERDDEFFLVEFDSAPRLTIPLTGQTGQIRTEVMMTKTAGSTAMIDGVFLAIHEIKKSKRTKKALVLISDGGENHSRYTPAELKNLVKESDVMIYTVAAGGAYYADERFGQDLMKQIAELTGAHMYYASSVDLAEIAQKIGIELRNRYVIGYAPPEMKRDGRYHKIDLKVIAPRGLPRLKAHWRRGYYAPAE
jgi:Ca-activated chloride channel family protein